MRQPTLLPILLLLLTAHNPIHALTALPAGVDITEDTPGQVTINGDPTGNTTLPPDIPISATLFSGGPGSRTSTCRGSLLLELTFPPSSPPSEGDNPTAATETCYNLPLDARTRAAGCGNFVAGKGAGCEARLFSERDCRAYVNTAVFVPEERAVGGVWRSLAVKCGVPAPEVGEFSLGALGAGGVVRRPGGGG